MMPSFSTVSGLSLLLASTLALSVAGCGSDETQAPVDTSYSTTRSSTLAVTSDDKTLWVVNQDSDSVSVIDLETRTLKNEIFLTGSLPARDPATQRFEPKVTPRALALVDDGRKVYVAGQSANKVYLIQGETQEVVGSIDVPAEPTGIAASPDGSFVYVVCRQADKVLRINTVTDAIDATVDVSDEPWNVTVSADGNWLYVPHLLLGPGVTVIDARAMTVRNKVALADEPVPVPFNKKVPNGPARGLYGAIPRPGTGEIWVPHLLLAVDTAETDSDATNLDFESTVFPTVSTITADGTSEQRRLLFKAPGTTKGSFLDSVSGPHDISFTPDGSLALVAMGQSEDIMVFDAESGTQRQLVRPLPSAMLEGIVVNHAGTRAYVEGRNTHDITVLRIDPANATSPVAVDGGAIERLLQDPMPAELRHGQRLFYTANNAQFPITKNFWVACASCHVEGGSDAVTWQFFAGPRDTPSNAGGMLGTGFLLRQAIRTEVQQYDETIRVEQGGNYHLDEPSQKADLDALAAYVNYAIPFPQNPYLAADGSLSEAQKRGKGSFDSACASCHFGEFLTDSGMNNPSLDLSGEIVLHDIGTCVTKGDFRDRKSLDVEGNERTACDFDTPTLRGIFASAPYFHDGSALTLRDVVDRLPFSSGLSEGDKTDLVEYIKTL